MHRFYGDSLAQQVEHIPFKDGVVGSNPTRITRGNRWQRCQRFLCLYFFLKNSIMNDVKQFVNLGSADFASEKYPVVTERLREKCVAHKCRSRRTIFYGKSNYFNNFLSLLPLSKTLI